MKCLYKVKWAEGDDKWHILCPLDDAFVMDFPDCANFRRQFNDPSKEKDDIYIVDICKHSDRITTLDNESHDLANALVKTYSSLRKELTDDKYRNEGGKKLAKSVEMLYTLVCKLADKSLMNKENMNDMKNSISVQFVIGLLIAMLSLQMMIAMSVIVFCKDITKDAVKISNKLGKMEVYIQDLEDVVFNGETTLIKKKGSNNGRDRK